MKGEMKKRLTNGKRKIALNFTVACSYPVFMKNCSYNIPCKERHNDRK